MGSEMCIRDRDIFHEETDSIVRSFTFSRGQREYLVVIDPRFHIAGISSKSDSNLMTQIYNVLNGLMWQLMNGGLPVVRPKIKNRRYR